MAERSAGRCELDHRHGAFDHVHHRRPRGRGGTWVKERNGAANLLALCRFCHDRVEANRTWAIGEGLLLRPLEVAEETAVRLHHLYGWGWWQLDDQGFISPARAPSFLPADQGVQPGLTPLPS